jgi:hypothetical protein
MIRTKTTVLRHEGVWGSGCIIHVFLTSALVGGEWSASHPGRFTSKEIASGTSCIGGWVGPRGGMDAVEKDFVLPGIEIRPSSP